MTEELHLVKDLALILISAGVFTILFKALKQPLILGYIIAGFIIGPHLGIFGISSTETVEQWSEIGMIFLMFGLGLEFSFKKLIAVGGGALVTAGSKFLGVFVLGFMVGQAMSWTFMESVFLAGLLSMSSTVVVIKSYDDLGLKRKPYASIVFGTLVVEDLIAILLMVLLSTMAVSNKFAGGEMLFNIGKLIFFLILWFLTGIFVIPTVLKKARKYITDEILLIVSIGLCFGMVALASAAGFSTALGAFVMGSILAETVESEHILKLTGSIKDLFGAIFFISVGMMIDPAVVVEHWFMIFILALVVITTHILFAGAGVILSGGGLDNAVHTGFSLAQLGEFGFIIASVGCSLGVMRSFIYPVIITVSVITIFTTPFVIKLADPAYMLLQRRLPASWLERLDKMERTGSDSIAEQSEWKKLLKAYFLRILLYGVVILAIGIGTDLYLEPLLDMAFPDWGEGIKSLSSLAITLILMSPFIYGLGVSTGSINVPAAKLLREKKANRWPILGLVLARTFLAVSIILFVIARHVTLAGWALFAILIAGALFILIARNSIHRNSALEKRFLSNLNEKEDLKRRQAPVTSSIKEKLGGYDVHIETIDLSPDSSFAGMRLKDIPIRAESGANIIKVVRGSSSMIIPDADLQLFPGDRLAAVGSTEQLGKLRKMFEESVHSGRQDGANENFSVVTITLEADSYLTGQMLKSTKLRDYHCMIVSVLRDAQLITNPRADFVFKEGDVVWLAGETESCDWLK